MCLDKLQLGLYKPTLSNSDSAFGKFLNDKVFVSKPELRNTVVSAYLWY